MSFSICNRSAPKHLLLIAIAACGCLAACNQLPTRHGSSVETLPSENLDRRAPVDVVVPPVENASADANVPLMSLRVAFQDGLVKRRYSPLSLEYVDRRVKDAAFRPGSLEEEAVFKVTVERWDTSLWKSHGALTVKMTARLLDSANPTGGDLWVGRLDRRFDFGPQRERFTSQQALWAFACEEIAHEILAALPARNASREPSEATP